MEIALLVVPAQITCVAIGVTLGIGLTVIVYEFGDPEHEVPPLETVGVIVIVETTGLDTLIEALKVGIVEELPLAGIKPIAGFIAQVKVELAMLELKGVAGTVELLQYVALLTGFATGIGIIDIEYVAGAPAHTVPDVEAVAVI